MSSPDQSVLLGCLAAQRGALAEAEGWFRQALELEPDSAEALSNLGNALREQGRGVEALGCLQQAIRLKPGFWQAHLNLGTALEEQDRLEEAEARFRTVLRLNARSALAHNNLGSVLKKLGRLEEALEHLREAHALAPELAEAHCNLGAVYEQMGRLDEALRAYEQALRLRPHFVEAHLNRAMAWLLLGNFQQGWQEYEWRWQQKGAEADRFLRPLWDGTPFPDQTLLVHAEQGLGDTVHFARYLPLVKERGGRVVLEGPARLVPLLASLRGVDELIRRGEPLPEFDLHAPLVSLPRILGTRLTTIPAQVPYLGVCGIRLQPCPSGIRLQPCPSRDSEKTGLEAYPTRIGLVWASNPGSKNWRTRSMALAELAPLGRVPGVALYSLQRGPQAAELERAPAGLRITRLEEESGDVLDTAAAILNLDLVISVDTLVAHLAGALAKPVWTLLPFAPDFRWLLARQDSPWYPTMRLFRQPRPGDWRGVVEQVVEALCDADRG